MKSYKNAVNYIALRFLNLQEVFRLGLIYYLGSMVHSKWNDIYRAQILLPEYSNIFLRGELFFNRLIKAHTTRVSVSSSPPTDSILSKITG